MIFPQPAGAIGVAVVAFALGVVVDFVLHRASPFRERNVRRVETVCPMRPSARNFR